LKSDTEHRLDVLYRLDQEAPIRTSQDNPSVQAVYTNWLGEPDSETSVSLTVCQWMPSLCYALNSF